MTTPATPPADPGRTIGWATDGTTTCNTCTAAHYGTTPRGIIDAVRSHLDHVRRNARTHLPLALARVPRPIAACDTSERPPCDQCRTALR